MTDQQKAPRVRKTAEQKAREVLDRADRKLAAALKAQAHHEEALSNIRPEVERARAEREYAAQHPALAGTVTDTDPVVDGRPVLDDDEED